MSKLIEPTDFDVIMIIALLVAAVYYFAIGEPWIGLASIALMNWFRY